jgi:hypothetical protein
VFVCVWGESGREGERVRGRRRGGEWWMGKRCLGLGLNLYHTHKFLIFT